MSAKKNKRIGLRVVRAGEVIKEGDLCDDGNGVPSFAIGEKCPTEWLVLRPIKRTESPANAIATGTEARVCADIAERQQKGIAKYGTTVEGNDGNLLYWLSHAYQEELDKTIYIKRAMECPECDFVLKLWLSSKYDDALENVVRFKQSIEQIEREQK